jgi:ribonuclease G
LYVTDVISPTEEALEDDEDQAVAEPPDAPGNGGHDAPAPEAAAADTDERRGDPSDDEPANAGNGSQPASSNAPPSEPAQPQNGGGRPQSAPRSERRGRDRTPPDARIEDLLKEGQEVVVQVVKEPLGTKGARITSHLSLPGRFLVYMPTVEHIGVSRKIESRDERRRLRGIVQRFREQSGLPGGCIIRTAAANRSEDDILTDLTYFQQVWQDIQRRRESERTPAALFREESLVTKLLRDLLNEQFQAIRLDQAEEYQRTVGFVQRIMPRAAILSSTRPRPLWRST